MSGRIVGSDVKTATSNHWQDLLQQGLTALLL
jgi:hypothetical protein